MLGEAPSSVASSLRADLGSVASVLNRRSRSAFETTKTLESAIAAPAISGLR